MKHSNKWAAAIAGIGLLSLAACGTNGTSEENGQSTNDPETESTGETIEYEALNGVQQIPANPERVVLLSDVYFGYFMELGVDVIATTDFVFESPYLEEYTDGVENLGDSASVSVEDVLALDPDLIIAYHSSEILDQLESITTTVAVDYATLGYKDQLQEFGEMLGREEQADQWINDWEEQIETLKPAVQEAVGEQTISILQPTENDVYAYGNGWGRGGEIMYEEFELNMPETVKEAVGSDGYSNVSLEAVPEYAGDFILTAPWSSNLDGEFLYESSIWEGLPAVQEERVFEMDPVGYYFNDPISIEQHLEDISSFLMKDE